MKLAILTSFIFSKHRRFSNVGPLAPNLYNLSVPYDPCTYTRVSKPRVVCNNITFKSCFVFSFLCE